MNPIKTVMLSAAMLAAMGTISYAGPGVTFPVSPSVTVGSTVLAPGASTSALQPAIASDGGALSHLSNTTLPLAAGAALSALQPPLNADGGAASHVTNFPTSWTVTDPYEAPFQGVVPITPGTPTTALRSVGFVITSAGNVTFTFSDGSTLTLALPVGGFTTEPFAVTNVALGTGTAGTFENLK